MFVPPPFCPPNNDNNKEDCPWSGTVWQSSCWRQRSDELEPILEVVGIGLVKEWNTAHPVSVRTMSPGYQLKVRKDLKKARNMSITQNSKSVCMWATDSPKAESLFLLSALSLSPSPQHKYVFKCVFMCHLCVHTHTPEFLRTCAREKILPEELLRHNQELWDCSSHLLMKGSL